MGMEKPDITAAELADILRTSTDTLRKRWSRNFPGQSFNASAVLSPEQRAVLSGGRGHKKHKASTGVSGGRRAKVSAPSPDKVAEAKPRLSLDALRKYAFDGGCILAVVGHAGLIWYDCATLWLTPGVIGGGMAFVFACLGLLIATDPSKPRTSGYALGFMFCVDFAAWFVHYPTFTKTASIGDVQTGVLCGFICLLSFAALYLYQDSKLD